MSHSHNFTKTSAVTSVITTEQSTVIYNGGVWDYRHKNMIIDQANVAAELSGRIFNKTNRFAQNESANRFESECSSSGQIFNKTNRFAQNESANRFESRIDSNRNALVHRATRQDCWWSCCESAVEQCHRQ